MPTQGVASSPCPSLSFYQHTENHYVQIDKIWSADSFWCKIITKVTNLIIFQKRKFFNYYYFFFLQHSTHYLEKHTWLTLVVLQSLNIPHLMAITLRAQCQNSSWHDIAFLKWAEPFCYNFSTALRFLPWWFSHHDMKGKPRILKQSNSSNQFKHIHSLKKEWSLQSILARCIFSKRSALGFCKKDVDRKSNVPQSRWPIMET